MNVLILNHCLIRNDQASATNTTGRGKKNSDPSGQSVEVYVQKQNVWNVQTVNQISWQTIVACHQQQDEASAVGWVIGTCIPHVIKKVVDGSRIVVDK